MDSVRDGQYFAGIGSENSFISEYLGELSKKYVPKDHIIYGLFWTQ